MKFDYGTIIVIVAVLLFYLRLILLQWGKSKRLRDLQTIQPKAKSRKNAPAAPRTSTADVMRFRFGNIYLTVLAVVLMIGGALLAGIGTIPLEIRTFWWLPTTAGVILFGFLIR